MKRFCVVAAVLVLLAIPASAQTTSGWMSGTVRDESDHLVPGADVTIVHEHLRDVRTGITGALGEFSFPGLLPGPYTIRVHLGGFKTLESTGHMVVSNSRLAVPALRLQVGGLSEAVMVKAQGEALATTRTSHEGFLDLNQVQNLSIRGRDPISLLKILPGVSLLPNDQEAFGGSWGTFVPNIQGGRGQTLYVDGVNAGDGGGGGTFSGATSIDAIAEVQVQMSSYTAEYGLKGGAQVNFITKHGGSVYHGTAYTHQRHQRFNATNYFNKRNSLPKPEYRYSNVGGTVGGPVPWLGTIGRTRDRLFFFYSVDDTQLKNPQPLRRFTVPTAMERQGDFSQTRTTSGALILIRDPSTGSPFPGNRIPVGRAHPAGLAYLNMLPMPNIDASGYNYVMQEASIPHPRRQHLLRVDYRHDERSTLSVKYQSWYTKSVGWNTAGSSWGLVRQRYDFTADQGKIDYTRLLNPSTVLEFAAGVFQSTEDGPPENDIELGRVQRKNYQALAHLPQLAAVHNPLGVIPFARWGGLQNTSNGGVQPDIALDPRWPVAGADTNFIAALNVTHTRGPHTLKAGVMREHELFGQARAGIFPGQFSFANNLVDPGNTGFAFANAFIGHVTDYAEDMGRAPNFRRQNTWAWFVQDTWKINRQLTVDVGLRTYKWGHPYSGTGEASAFSFERFDPTWSGRPPVLYRPTLAGNQRQALNPLTGEILPATFIGLMVPGTGYSCGVITANSPCAINGVVVQNDPTYSKGKRGFVDPPPLQFDPRVGLAWAINPHTVLRMATGIFHDGTGGDTFEGGPAFQFTRVTRFTDLDSYLGAAGATAPVGVNGILRGEVARPSTHKYTIAIQRQIGWNVVADVAYVGDFTRHISVSKNYNAIPAGARFLPENRDPTRPDSATVGLQENKADPGALPDVFLRPIPGFLDIFIREPAATGRYDSLQAQVSRRFMGRFEVAGSYTLARGYSTIPFQNNPLTGKLRIDNTNLQRHVAVVSYMVEVPDAARLLGNSRFMRPILSGWRLSGISTFATGPLTDVGVAFTPNFDFSGGGETCGLVVQTGDPNKGARQTEEEWFRTSVFARPGKRGDLGNSCNSPKIVLPGFHNHDVSISKDVAVSRAQRLTFKTEFYNVFNTRQWQSVDTFAQFDATGAQTNRNFGRVTSARTERRVVLSLRYTY